jgi:hypothetical protein
MRIFQVLMTLSVLALLSCSGTRFYKPGKLSAEEHIVRMKANFAGFSEIGLSYNAQLESRETGQIPFKIDLLWSEDDFVLDLKTPFGGELAQIRCKPKGAQVGEIIGVEAGDRLGKNLSKALKRVKDPTLRNLLDRGLEALKGKDKKLEGGFDVELSDPRLAPIMSLIDMGRFSDFIHNSPCNRDVIGRWFWGALIPGSDADFNYDPHNGNPESSFSSGDTVWVIDELSGFCKEMRTPGFVIQNSDFEKKKKSWLPRKIRIVETDSSRQLILNRRRLQLEYAE